MKRRFAWHLVALAATFLAAGTARAAVQGQYRVCSLGVGGWQLFEQDGRVYLVKPRPVELRRGRGARWYVSAPAVKDEKGRFLAADPSGRRASVHLVRGSGPHAQWTFDVTAHLSPGMVESGKGSWFKEGPSGFQFKLRMAGGPYKGWYLAAEELTEEQKKREGRVLVLRPLKLVKDARKAAVFTYVEVQYEVDHK
jgi:hypothetical protein